MKKKTDGTLSTFNEEILLAVSPIHVDDELTIAKDPRVSKAYLESMRENFDIKVEGKSLEGFLGVQYELVTGTWVRCKTC